MSGTWVTLHSPQSVICAAFIALSSFCVATPTHAQHAQRATIGADVAGVDSEVVRAQRYLSNSDTDSAITQALHARALARSLKQDSFAVLASGIAITGSIWVGRLDAAASLARQELGLARARSDTSAETRFLISLADIAVLTGQADSATFYLNRLRMQPLSPSDSTSVAQIDQTLSVRLTTLGDRHVAQSGGLLTNGDPLYGINQRYAKQHLGREGMRDSAQEAIARIRQDMRSGGATSRIVRYNRALDMISAFTDLEGRDSVLAYAEQARALAHPVDAAMAEAGVARAEVMRGSRASLERAVRLYDSASVATVHNAPRSAAMRAKYDELWSFLQRRVVQTLLALGEPEAALAANDMSYLQRADSDLAHGNVRVELAKRGRQLIQRAARTGLTHVVYAPLFDEVAVWTISPDGVAILTRKTVDLNWLAAAPYKLRLMLEMEAGMEPDPIQVDELGAAGAMLNAAGAKALAGQIASILLPPETAVLLPDSGEIVVVGTGPIGLIPFAALPRSSASNGDSTTALLGDRLAIRTLWALSDIVAEPHAPGRAFARENPLVVGDPLSGRSAELVVMQPNMMWEAVHIPALPNARAEVSAIGAMLGVRPILGAAATRARFVDRLGDATLVHFAGHAFTSDADESLMYLQFAINGDTAGTRLLARDILSPTTPPLHAGLVTLSACESGAGEARWTQGTLGLQRALLQRGAASVLSSLWRVRDVSTRILMETFYKEWLFAPDRPDKAEALRRAEMRVRSIPGYESPTYWAGWQLTGAR